MYEEAENNPKHTHAADEPVTQRKTGKKAGHEIVDNRPEAIVQRRLLSQANTSLKTVQLSGKAPSKAELDGSVADYKNKESDAKKAKELYQQAQKKHDKAVSSAHKAGNPMSSDDQKAGMQKLQEQQKEVARLERLAQASRRKSDKMHNDYRQANPSSANSARFGGAQRTLHQGRGSSANS